MEKLISVVKNNIKYLIIAVLFFGIVYVVSQFFYDIYKDVAISNIKNNNQKNAAIEQALASCKKQATDINYIKVNRIDCKNSYFVIGYQTGEEKASSWLSNLIKTSKPCMIVCHQYQDGKGELGRVEVKGIPSKGSCDNVSSINFVKL